MTPNRPSGRPVIWRSQSSTVISSSVAAGEVFHSIAFTLNVAVSISPRMAGMGDEFAK